MQNQMHELAKTLPPPRKQNTACDACRSRKVKCNRLPGLDKVRLRRLFIELIAHDLRLVSGNLAHLSYPGRCIHLLVYSTVYPRTIHART